MCGLNSKGSGQDAMDVPYNHGNEFTDLILKKLVVSKQKLISKYT